MNNKGSGIGTISWKFLRHWLSARHRSGHGIHSPYVYDFVRKVIYNEDDIKPPENILRSVKLLRRRQDKLKINDLGAGSRINNSDTRGISSIVKKSSVSLKQGALLLRLSTWYKPDTILELGTGLGISTAFLAAGSPSSKIHTIEGSFEKYTFAKKFLADSGFPSVELLNREFQDLYPDLVNKAKGRILLFIDGDHRYESSLTRSLALLKREDISEAILILDDIYWSKGMERAWRELMEVPEAVISIDMFYFGIIIKRSDIARQHFKIKI